MNVNTGTLDIMDDYSSLPLPSKMIWNSCFSSGWNTVQNSVSLQREIIEMVLLRTEIDWDVQKRSEPWNNNYNLHIWELIRTIHINNTQWIRLIKYIKTKLRKWFRESIDHLAWLFDFESSKQLWTIYKNEIWRIKIP